MKQRYIDFILNKCIYSNYNNKKLFISYDKENDTFIKELITKAKSMGYNEILVEETDYKLEHKLLNELTESEIEEHIYFNNPVWDKAASERYIFLLVSNNFLDYFSDIPKSKLLSASIAKNKKMKTYLDMVSKDAISWTIFALPNKLWADKLFPNDDMAFQKLENMIYSFSMIDDCSMNDFENYIRTENKKTEYLNKLKIDKLFISNDLGTKLTISLPDNYIFKSLKDNHCIENLPTYSVWTMPHKYKVNGIVYGTLPISRNNNLVSDYWFEFKDGKVVNYDAKCGKYFLDDFLSQSDSHKRLGEIAIIDSNSPIAKTNKIYNYNLFDENISTHLALGMAYKNTLLNGTKMTDEQLDSIGCNICDDHLDFSIGDKSLNIIAITKDKRIIEIFNNGIFNYELIGEKSPFIDTKYKIK